VLLAGLPREFHKRIAVLSGPNISREIALQKPSTTVVSSIDNDTATTLQGVFNNNYFRVYTNNDVIGTELGGTLKNIIAIAGGIIDGLNLGDNAKSAVMVRGLVEISRFAVKLGANPETFFGLAGIGDLITTCSSTLSRNHFVGEHLGRGMKLSEILREMTAVAEGVATTRLVHQMARENGVEMPVTEQVYEVLFKNKPVEQAIRDLMTRDAKAES
jgi:glycerol-3-phosphate dehydrogenase (NAD(P)+)